MIEQLTLFDPVPFEWEPDEWEPDFACLDCGVLTHLISEYYVLHDDVWLEANPADAGMLCIGCVEARLHRRLTPADFKDAPVNSERLSDRLWSRIHGVAS